LTEIKLILILILTWIIRRDDVVIPESDFERVLGQDRVKELEERQKRRSRSESLDEDLGLGEPGDDSQLQNDLGEFDRGLYALKTVENVKEQLDMAKKHVDRMLENAAKANRYASARFKKKRKS
jgi:hypothetical protein